MELAVLDARQFAEPEVADALDAFFQQLPEDKRYHLEIRTDLYLRDTLFTVLEKHGIGQVYSHWTWLPPLRKQLAKADGKFFNAGGQCLIRLLTPLRMRYEDSYLQAYPFDRLVEGMGDRFRLSPAGLALANQVMAELV